MKWKKIRQNYLQSRHYRRKIGKLENTAIEDNQTEERKKEAVKQKWVHPTWLVEHYQKV